MVFRQQFVGGLIAALGASALVAAPAVAAEQDAAMTYLRERAYAQWVVPTDTTRQVIVYTISAATYEDVETGTTLQLAELTRSRCVGTQEARECGTPQVEEYVEPRVFDVADDLSKAKLVLRVGSTTVFLEWVPHPVDRDADDFLPLTAEYTESCPEGAGDGRGLYRRMQVSGSVLAKRFAVGSPSVVRSRVDRAVIRTECQRP